MACAAYATSLRLKILDSPLRSRDVLQIPIASGRNHQFQPSRPGSALPASRRLRPFDCSGRCCAPGRADAFEASFRNGRSLAPPAHSAYARFLVFSARTGLILNDMSGRRPVVKGLVEALRTYRVRSCLRPVCAGNECPAGPDAGPHGSSPNQQNALVTALPFPRASEPSVGSHRFAVALDADRLAAKPRSC